jgi:hypothetical protein
LAVVVAEQTILRDHQAVQEAAVVTNLVRVELAHLGKALRVASG